MKLPLDRARHAALFELLAALADHGTPAVLVGGLVPPLLLEHLDPVGFDGAGPIRRTTDCDIIVSVSVEHGLDQQRRVEQILTASFRPDRRANQFRWNHPSGLRLDLIPVPTGVESGDPGARRLAAQLLGDVDAEAFYAGHELAVATAIAVTVEGPDDSDRPIAVTVEGPDDSDRPIAITALAPLLVMKLRAWEDSYRGRARDAYDIAWLLRYLEPNIAIEGIREARSRRPDLVDHVIHKLDAEFSDPDHAGVMAYAAEAFGRLTTDQTEPHRNAVAAAVLRILDGLRG